MRYMKWFDTFKTCPSTFLPAPLLTRIFRVALVALPPKIKCGRCFKSFNQPNFSNKQLTDARYQVLKFGKINKAPNCQKCSGQQIVEIECTRCDKTKGLEEFAKSQIRKPDTAVCFKCTEVQLSQTAINDDLYDDNQLAFLPPESSAGNYPEYFSSANSTIGSSDQVRHVLMM